MCKCVNNVCACVCTFVLCVCMYECMHICICVCVHWWCLLYFVNPFIRDTHLGSFQTFSVVKIMWDLIKKKKSFLTLCVYIDVGYIKSLISVFFRKLFFFLISIHYIFKNAVFCLIYLQYIIIILKFYNIFNYFSIYFLNLCRKSIILKYVP